MQTDEQIKRISEKLQQLLKQQALLQKENLRLKQALENSEAENKTLREMTGALQQQVEILKISSGTWNEADKKDFEKRINQYLREIDQCIALMSR
jgi:uncharacterized protein with PhoU and TrkA domain